jgi:hypothetical protein
MALRAVKPTLNRYWSCATALADEPSVEDILAIEHDVFPLDGADVF